MTKKVIGGLGKIGKVLTEPNTIADGGGLSAALVPRRFTGTGAAVVMGGMGAFALGNEALKGRNKGVIGSVKYIDGPARMTRSYTSGAVNAMHRVSEGNYGVFSDMAHETVGGTLETYGATPELISALYHMGGR